MSLWTRLRRAFLLYRAVSRNPRTPFMAKALPWLSILYILWPIDLVPDLIPLLGQLDDLAIIPLLIYLALRMTPSDIRKQASRDVIDVGAVKR